MSPNPPKVVAKINVEPPPPPTVSEISSAVSSIRLSNPSLINKLDAGFSKMVSSGSLSARVVAPTKKLERSHPIIPPAPYAAFMDASEKAIESSKFLSRSATICHALARLATLSEIAPGAGQRRKLTIDCVGADVVETSDVKRLFNPVFRWVRDFLRRSTSNDGDDENIDITINLVGPMIPLKLHRKTLISNECEDGRGNDIVKCFSDFYHVYLSSPSAPPTDRTDLAISFNSGLWGYDDWIPTLSYLSLLPPEKSLDVVFTSYTVEEGKDDWDKVFEVCSSGMVDVLWPPQRNVFSSRVERKTMTKVEGREYFENFCWIGLRFGENGVGVGVGGCCGDEKSTDDNWGEFQSIEGDDEFDFGEEAIQQNQYSIISDDDEE